jgi:hypothetical protein
MQRELFTDGTVVETRSVTTVREEEKDQDKE